MYYAGKLGVGNYDEKIRGKCFACSKQKQVEFVGYLRGQLFLPVFVCATDKKLVKRVFRPTAQPNG